MTNLQIFVYENRVLLFIVDDHLYELMASGRFRELGDTMTDSVFLPGNTDLYPIKEMLPKYCQKLL